ncbi:Ankyrin repeat-containing domain protein [Lactarius tabidus]
MSSDLQAISPTPSFQLLFNEALKEYRRKTGKDITAHPLAEEIKSCDSPDAILAVLQGKANELNQSQSSDERLTGWLTPTVNVLNALSATLGQGVGTVFPPTQVIFSGISILLVAARDAAASRVVLVELFEQIKNFFVRLKTYTEVPQNVDMTNVLGKIMAEVLSMLAIATKEMKQGRKKTFFRKLVGRTEIEDALRRMDKLEQGELRTVAAQVLKTNIDLKNDAKETKTMVQQIVRDMSAMSSQSWELLLQDLRGWLSPPDPSTNHNIACDTQHERTATWVFNEDIFKEWESSGSLLWIHGKAGSGKSILCSAIIQHIMLHDSVTASMAYFYFDFRDVDKKNPGNLLRSLLMQLSSQSEHCADILSRLHSNYKFSKGQPSERALVKCLKDMLMALSSSQFPTYIILDALDECPNTSGIPTPRDHLLGLLKDLVDLHLQNLHICVTSRLEPDIRTALKPLASGHLSLHDQPGQKRDIAKYVISVVQSDIKMKNWREDDRKLVIQSVSEKADGMFRWVFCQLEMLRHCLPPSLRRQLNELPKSLDETYERVLKEIESTNQGRHAHRLLQCLAVAMRPLRVEELAEVLAFDSDAANGEAPMFHAEWRWEDQEQAVLSACSSLISIVGRKGSRVVQFSHFSVKEYLTSNRLNIASGEISRYHIVPEPAHLVLAQACVGVLLNLDMSVKEESNVGARENGGMDIPLLRYAAEHWTSHAQVGNVSSRLEDAMETLFDENQPFFLAWQRIYNIDGDPPFIFCAPGHTFDAKPLYFAAICGFYDLVRRLLAKQPRRIYHHGGYHHSPLVAALSRKHVRVAELLVENCADVNTWRDPPLCRAIEFPDDTRVSAVQFLLGHGADVNIRQGEGSLSPLHLAAKVGCTQVVRILFENRADVDLRDSRGLAPLDSTTGGGHFLTQPSEEHSIHVDVQDINGATPLHFASYHGRPKIAQLLLSHGANPHAKNVKDRCPLHELIRGIHGDPTDNGVTYGYCVQESRGVELRVRFQNALSVAQILLEYGVDANALDQDHASPLHFASSCGGLEIMQILLDHDAKANVENSRGQTPLHVVSQSECFSRENSNVARLLLELGLDVNARDKDGDTPLHFACFHGNFKTALVLLDHGAEVNAQNADGQTPLHRVSQSSDYDNDDNPLVAQLMLKRGADVNSRDKDQATPLHLASYYSKSQTARVLLDYGAESEAQNADGQTPLHRTSQGLHYRCDDNFRVPQLLLEHGVDVNARDKDQETPLHSAAYTSRLETIRVLLGYGADVSAKNIRGHTPLHVVSFYTPGTPNDRSLNAVRLLLKHGADVNARDRDQATPLHLASFRQMTHIARVLFDSGAEVNAINIHGQNALHLASQNEYCNANFVKLLLSWGMDVNSRDKGTTPLHWATYFGCVNVVEVLLERGAQSDAEDIRGQTPLHLVVLGSRDYHRFKRVLLFRKDGAICVAQRLLERGAHVNAQNKDHETPLHLASRLRLLELAQLFLNHGAYVDVKNSKGKSPLQLARGRKRRAMRQMLLEYSPNKHDR